MRPPERSSFYTDEEQTAAETRWPRDEVAQAFRTYRAAVDVADHDTMASMLSTGGRGGNATFGLCSGREAYRRFLADRWHEIIPNESVWHAIDGGRVLDKWCELLPGSPPAGGRYEYFGIEELIYAGAGEFCLMYSIPDLFGLRTLYATWKADGQHEEFGDIYPGL